jgi:hypothetical protein
MDWGDTLQYLAIVSGGVLATIVVVHLIWRVHGLWKIRRAGPRHLAAIRHRIWREPSSSDSADLSFGPGGRDGVPAPLGLSRGQRGRAHAPRAAGCVAARAPVRAVQPVLGIGAARASVP